MAADVGASGILLLDNESQWLAIISMLDTDTILMVSYAGSNHLSSPYILLSLCGGCGGRRKKKKEEEMRVVNSFVLLLLASRVAASWDVSSSPGFSRDDFPKDFVFGSGTSAYQVEGAAAEDGRSPSIWDTYAHAGYVQGTGDIASDEYHKYKEDVRLMAETGLEGYRFSISWSRLIPNGRGKVNPKGLEYYNNLINELLRYGIEPHATLFHYDHPQVLEDEYGGWVSPKIVDDFTAYADVCFREFGDRVSHWTTLNEPNVFMVGGYDVGFLPPTRCSYPFGNCSHGDSTTEPYIAAHHCLLAHSSAAQLYKRKYKDKQQGLIGLNVFVYYFLPLTNSTEDVNATKRARDFYNGWFVEPLVHGDYPEIMKKAAGTKMLEFSKNESKQLMDSFDFIGLNYYNTVYVAAAPNNALASPRDWFGDMAANITYAEEMSQMSDTEVKSLTVQGSGKWPPRSARGIQANLWQPTYLHTGKWSTNAIWWNSR